MEPEDFDEPAFFRSLHAHGVRYLLIGRRAIAALGAPVLTADYDLWVAFDDLERLNEAASPFDLAPTCTPTEARHRGRYVLEGPERVDVLLTRSRTTPEGTELTFEDAYARRVATTAFGPAIPSIDDLITTKRWASRPKDVLDIQFLERLKEQRG